jgi:hypothetical protein
LDELTLKGNATGLVDYTCTWFANASTTPSAPTPSMTDVRPPPGWTAAISIGGTQIPYVVDWEMDLKRGVKPIPALTGTQEYFQFFADVLQSTGKITVIEQSGAPQITQYLNGDTQSLDITLYDLASGFAMNLHSTNTMWKTADVDRSKPEVEVPLEFQMLPSAADAKAGGVSPIICTVANDLTSVYN